MDDLTEVAEHLPSAPVSPALGIGAMALAMAVKYHSINTVQDGQLYQQYKLEGRNMRDLDLAAVFDTAMQIEVHLLTAERRIADFIAGALIDGLTAEAEEQQTAEVAP